MRWNKNKHEFPAFDLENICQSPGINFRRLETIKVQAILGFKRVYLQCCTFFLLIFSYCVADLVIFCWNHRVHRVLALSAF
jgi:hypothetical protein